MHKRTFDVLKPGAVVTVWDDTTYRGHAGTVHTAEAGRVVVKMKDGAFHSVGYREACCGDNSYERYPESRHEG